MHPDTPLLPRPLPSAEEGQQGWTRRPRLMSHVPVYSLHPEQAALLEHKEPKPSSVRKRELILLGLQSEGGEKRPWREAQEDQGQARHRHREALGGGVSEAVWTLAPGTSAPALAQWAGGHRVGKRWAERQPPSPLPLCPSSALWGHPAGRTLQKVPGSLLSCSTGHCPIHKPLPSGLSVLPMVFSEPIGVAGENHHLK